MASNPKHGLARHSDPNLTLGTYSHTRLESLAAVVNRLHTCCPQAQSLSVSSGPGAARPAETTEDHEGRHTQSGPPVSL